MSHARAWAHLAELRKVTLENYSLEDMVAEIFRYGNGFFGPDQIWDEILEALKEVRALKPRYIVEIGTAGGGTLAMWSRVAHPEAKLVSIDLPGAQKGMSASRLRVPFFRLMGLPGQTIHVIRADSHDPDTVARARRCLGENDIDFLFIDGDHTAQGVRADYEMYGPLVRPGGLIAFHDIAVESASWCQVREFWRELSKSQSCRSIASPSPTYGIGLLYR